MEWLSCLDEQELRRTVRSAAGRAYSDAASFNDLGWELTCRLLPNERGLGVNDQLWDRIKIQFQVFICTNDKEYSDLRKNASEVGRNGQTAVVAMVAGALGSVVGVSAAAIAPAISLLFIALLRIGRNAYCDSLSLNLPISSGSKGAQ